MNAVYSEAWYGDCLDAALEQVTYWRRGDHSNPSMCWTLLEAAPPARPTWGAGLMYIARRLVELRSGETFEGSNDV